jgi:hypothetical protein
MDLETPSAGGAYFPSWGRAIRAIAFLITALACRAAEIEFVGVMADSAHAFFAVRESKASKPRWITIGDEVAGFVVQSYDSKADTLTLTRAGERVVLRLPESRVQMARDEVIEGLARVLGAPDASRMSDLLHPKLRALFTEANLDSHILRDILSAGAKVEVREIPEDFAKALHDGLSEVEKAVGVRPTHGIWIEWKGHLSMSFVVKSGETWFLAPSVPGAKR